MLCFRDIYCDMRLKNKQTLKYMKSLELSVQIRL